MSEHAEPLSRRIDRLADRIARIETFLELEGSPGVPETPPAVPRPDRPETRAASPSAAPPPVPAASVAPAPPPRSPTPPTVPPPVPLPPPDARDLSAAARQFRAAERLPSVTPPRAVTTTPLEFIVGVKWMAWVGAAAVVMTVGFFLKLAYDQGWWGAIPAGMRCMIGAAFGAALLGCGEVALRRVGRAASVGLYSAGLATLYLVSWAAFGYYDLISEQAAFMLMGLVAVGGFAVTLRTQFRTIGVLSILAGYSTPLLIESAVGNQLQLLGYLTMLLIIALGLSAFRPRHFRTLRYVALGAQSVIALFWLVTDQGRHWEMAIVFLSIWWVMLLAECTIAAVRRQSAVGNIVATMLATLGYVSAGTWVLAGLAPAGAEGWLGTFTFMIAVLGAAVALQFGPGLETLRERPSNAMEKLAVALWAQSGVLIAVAVALQFDGFGESIAWLALALGAVETGRRLPSPGVIVFGLVTGALALARIAVFDWWATALQLTLFETTNVSLTGWGLLALVAVASVFIAAVRLGEPDRSGCFVPWPAAASVLTGLGAVGFAAVVAAECTGLAITALWLAGAVAMLAARNVAPRLPWVGIGVGLLATTAARWVIVDAVLGRLDPAWDPRAALPVVNAQMAMAVAIAATGWWAARVVRASAGTISTTPARTGLRQTLVVATTLLILGALSFEIDRVVERMIAADAVAVWTADHARQLLFTLLWSLGAVWLGVAATVMTRVTGVAARGVGGCGIALLASCACKWVLLDTLAWTVQTGHPVTAALPVFNLQMLVALALGAATVLLVTLARRNEDPTQPSELSLVPSRSVTQILVVLLVFWGLTFEVDRLVARAELAGRLTTFAPELARGLWWTLLWAAGGGVLAGLGHARRLTPTIVTGLWIQLVAVTAWLLPATLGPRLIDGPVAAPVLLNMQCLVGVALAVLLAASLAVTRSVDDRRAGFALTSARRLAVVGIGMLVLWIGSFEIDRAFIGQPMSVQTGLSVYWCLCSIALILLGFARGSALVRYVGLAMFSVTTLKVFVIDLQQVDRVWRMVSFGVLGILLIATSVIYARLAPRLIASAARPEVRPGGDPDARPSATRAS